MADLNEIQRKLGGETVKPIYIEKTKKKSRGGKNYVPTGKGSNNNRNGGRPPKEETIITKGIKAWMDEHANEQVPLTFVDRKTGKAVTIKKPRRVIAIEKLFEIGTRGEKATGNVAALNAWLDRYAGKPAQPIRGEGEDDPPIKLHVDNLGDILKKVYGE